jgi:ferredoxin/NAD(P)H-dependent FMN reductase
MDTNQNRSSALLFYLSPHGTTEKAMGVLAAVLQEAGLYSVTVSFSDARDPTDAAAFYRRMERCRLLVLASPTYFHHAPPVFSDFVRRMPESEPGQSVALLSTFGGVSSGVILHDLATILYRKRYRLIGGMQVLAEHSLTFQQERPFLSGHPDENDLAAVQAFGREIVSRLTDPACKGYLPEDFEDKPALMSFVDRHLNRLENFTWAMPPVKVDPELCAGCGLCASACPTDNIRLVDDIAVHGENCIHCYGCVRNCPSGSASAFLKPALPTVRSLARMFARYEAQVTKQVV